jgi:hypothetical protein
MQLAVHNISANFVDRLTWLHILWNIAAASTPLKHTAQVCGSVK